MFGFLKKERRLCCICDGSLVEISRVPDKVFSQKILGDGYAIIPSSGIFSSPANGTITDITSTSHALCITTDDGLEILVHIGLDTVELKGQGFKPAVKIGDTVRMGDTILTADLNQIKDAGYNTISMTVITNSDKMKDFSVHENPSVKAGSTALTYTI